MVDQVAAEKTLLSPGIADDKISVNTVKGQRLSFLVIGAGSRGNAYAEALSKSTSNAECIVGAIAEPVAFKREAFGKRHIWGSNKPHESQSHETWQDFLIYEKDRRNRWVTPEDAPQRIDGIFVCTLDDTHVEIITAFAPLGLHIMSEKPLATTWRDCLRIYRSLQPPGTNSPKVIFSTGHVLRYSPHNILLRKLLLEDFAIGDIISIEHTEPVGWWHFSHSYVRGNWRNDSKTAPSLLTKSCHDIDLILWLLCSPLPNAAVNSSAHLPAHVSSTGSLLYYKKARKPRQAGNATNCLSCAAERECLYSAKRIYEEGKLHKGNAGWPINIIDPEIEDLYKRDRKEAASERLRQRLAEDYDGNTTQDEIDSRPWFGRCVYECDNNVCDDQVVTLSWDDEPLKHSEPPYNRGAKNAIFHMVASTEKQCERRGYVYGTHGEISYDSTTIRVVDFATEVVKVYHPKQMGGGHGGGDVGLAMGFFDACKAVKRGMAVEEAQSLYLGCTLEEVVRSHAVVFAAEEARIGRKSVEWGEWWQRNVGEASGEGGMIGDVAPNQDYRKLT